MATHSPLAKCTATMKSQIQTRKVVHGVIHCPSPLHAPMFQRPNVMTQTVILSWRISKNHLDYCPQCACVSPNAFLCVCVCLVVVGFVCWEFTFCLVFKTTFTGHIFWWQSFLVSSTHPIIIASVVIWHTKDHLKNRWNPNSQFGDNRLDSFVWYTFVSPPFNSILTFNICLFYRFESIKKAFFLFVFLQSYIWTNFGFASRIASWHFVLVTEIYHYVVVPNVFSWFCALSTVNSWFIPYPNNEYSFWLW